MKRLVLLTIALGVAVSFTACSATLRQNVKAEQSGLGQPQDEVTFAHRPDLWIYDTPFGY
jgi:hypothetical protein